MKAHDGHPRYLFVDELGDYTGAPPILISGATSVSHWGCDYLIETTEEGMTQAYMIMYDVHCSPFKEARRWKGLLVVGHEEHLHLFDTEQNRPLLVEHLEGYFGHLYQDQEHCYVASGHDLLCLEMPGRIKWRTERLGIDGVIIESIEGDVLHGAGEWDPPGGWRPFSLDRRTGLKW